MSVAGKWDDLPARIMSAVVMVAVGVAAVWFGGLWFTLLVVVIGGGMVWELCRMLGPDRERMAIPMGLLTTAALWGATLLPGEAVLPVLIAPAIVGATQLHKDRLIYGGYAAALMLACYGLMGLRADHGVMWVAWLVAVVIASDVAGYFVGRIVGGPKFWPKVSPKKTWSGTIGGWIAAGVVGAAFGGLPLVLMSVATAFAGQMGDAAESAIKRHTGVKDSSNLIPGHGGLLDRFDAMMGAALFVVIVSTLVGLP
ncbi:MAG: phosphatidate cytidylyltransferase [Pseudopelagicola sp.]|nr:phosphatidate cytidylyltransferase [Pseudopelagicola sp.]